MGMLSLNKYMNERYKRPLSDSERIWLGVNQAFCPFAIQAILEGSGRLDYERLTDAVEKASAANPGSRLVLKGILRGCHWIDSGKPPRIRKVQAGKWDGYSSTNAPFLMDDVPHNGPTCEVLYIEGDIPRIAFRSNHGVMDGRGMLTWMEDVFRVLRGENPIGSASTLTDYQLIESISDKKKRIDLFKCVAPTGKAKKEAKGVTWKRLTFMGSHTEIIGKVAVALARSAFRYQEGRFNIAIPVDLRSRKPGLRSTGNLSQTIYVEITKSATFASITEEIQRQLDNKNDCINIERGNSIGWIPLWAIKLFCRQIARSAHKQGLYMIPVCISNLGRIDTESLSGAGFTTESIFFAPPRADAQPAFVVLAGKTGRLELTLSVPNVLASNGRLDRLLDEIREQFS
jgi:hypothetical protein